MIRNTQIPVELILRKLGEGTTEQDLLDAYPNLKREGHCSANVPMPPWRSRTKRLCSASTRLRCCACSPTRAATSPLFVCCGVRVSTFYRLQRFRPVQTTSG